jgi:hypothetical protein
VSGGERSTRSGTPCSTRGDGPRLDSARTRRSDLGTFGCILWISGNLEDRATMFAPAVRTLEHLLKTEFPTALSTFLK